MRAVPFAITVLFWFRVDAQAATWEVCRDDPGCPPSIQAVVDQAASGDTIKIRPGIYDGGAITVAGKDLLIEGTNLSLPPVLSSSDAEVINLLSVTAGADVVVRGIDFASPLARGLHAKGAGTSVTIQDCLFAGTAFRDHGSAVFAEEGADVTVRYTVFEPSNAGIEGGQISARDASLTLEGCTFTGGSAGERGGAVHIEGLARQTLRVYQTVFQSSVSYGRGGAIAIEGQVEAEIVDCTFIDDSAALRGGAVAADLDGSGSLTISRASFQGGLAAFGGAMAVDGAGSVTLTDVAMTDNTAVETGGALAVDGEVALVLVRPTFCANTALYGPGGAVYYGDHRGVPSGPLAPVVWSNALFVDNASGLAGGGAYVEVGRPVSIQHATFLGNDAGKEGSALAVPSGGGTTLLASLVAWSIGSVAVYAPTGGLLAVRDVWFENGGTDLDNGVSEALSVGENQVGVDPMLYDYSRDRDCSNDDFGYRSGPAPSPVSPLRFTAGQGFNPDGTAADVGAFGGGDAALDAWSDRDGDAWVDLLDCADLDPAIAPGAPDACDDGIDENCDGFSDLDCDLDGFDGAELGGTDCDDADPAVHPGALEVPYDGIDQDCADGDLIDVDGDGYAADEVGGPDCDDRRPGIHPDAEENPNATVDRDCDGWASLTKPLRPVGCSSIPVRRSPWALIALALWRRRGA